MKNNHVELFGTLTRDIEVSKNGKGNNFVKFSLACLRDGKNHGQIILTVLPLVIWQMISVSMVIKIQDFVLLEIFVQALMKKMVKNSIQPMSLLSLLNC